MEDLIKFVTKIFLGTTAVAAGLALIRKGMENAGNIDVFPGPQWQGNVYDDCDDQG